MNDYREHSKLQQLHTVFLSTMLLLNTSSLLCLLKCISKYPSTMIHFLIHSSIRFSIQHRLRKNLWISIESSTRTRSIELNQTMSTVSSLTSRTLWHPTFWHGDHGLWSYDHSKMIWFQNFTKNHYSMGVSKKTKHDLFYTLLASLAKNLFRIGLDLL